LVGQFDFSEQGDADHSVTSAVRRQARGGFRFRTLHASTVLDNVSLLTRFRMQIPRNIHVVDRRLVEDVRPFGILSMSMSLHESLCIILIGHLPVTIVGVLAALFLDESAVLIYFEEEVLLSAVLFIVRGRGLALTSNQ